MKPRKGEPGVGPGSGYNFYCVCEDALRVDRLIYGSTESEVELCRVHSS